MAGKCAFFFLLLSSCAFGASAQSLQLINSTSQEWSGGVAGNYGTNYSFILETADTTGAIIPETLWVEHEPFALHMPERDNEPGMVRRVKKGGHTRYEIVVQVAHNEYEEQKERFERVKRPARPAPPVPINGVALVSYRINGKAAYLPVDKIMSVMEPAAYP